MEKNDIRKELIEKRDSIPSDVWSALSRDIERKVLKSPIYKEADKIFIYADFHNEVETVSIIETALVEGRAVYLPKVLDGSGESRMDFYRIDSTFELVDGYYGISEPVSGADRCFSYDECVNEKLLMFVPGVAFDKKGGRLGYGKGYYDNYLKDKQKIVTLGLAFDLQVVDELPLEPYDIKLDYLITESTSDEEISKFSYKG